MQRTRHNDRGPAYEEWKVARQLELDAEQAQQEAAQEAAENADPVKAFQKASDAEAQTVREIILNGYIPDTLLPNAQRIGGRKVLQEPAIRNFQWFAQNTPAFKPHYMGRPLLDAAERSDLAPTGPNYTALFNLMVQYGAFPDEPVQVVAPVEESAPALTRSEQAILDHQRFMEEIVGTDELGRQWTAFELDQLPAKDELRLRRLFEQGHRGSNLLTVRREFLDTKQIQDAERDRIAAEQNGGN